MSLEPSPQRLLDVFGLEHESLDVVETYGRVIVLSDYVFKPVLDPTETRWVCDVLDRLPPPPSIRISKPVRARTDDWIGEGYSCQLRLAGKHDMNRWNDVLRASDDLHVSLEGVEEPTWMRDSEVFCQRCDRFAWNEGDLTIDARASRTIDDIQHFVRPVEVRKQLIHGDLAGNVLFEAGQPLAIIDFTPYWRPALYASGIVVVDAISVRGARSGPLLNEFLERVDGEQMLLRAALFRAGTYGQTQFYDEYFAGFQRFADVFCGELELRQGSVL